MRALFDGNAPWRHLADRKLCQTWARRTGCVFSRVRDGEFDEAKTALVNSGMSLRYSFLNQTPRLSCFSSLLELVVAQSHWRDNSFAWVLISPMSTATSRLPFTMQQHEATSQWWDSSWTMDLQSTVKFTDRWNEMASFYAVRSKHSDTGPTLTRSPIWVWLHEGFCATTPKSFSAWSGSDPQLPCRIVLAGCRNQKSLRALGDWIRRGCWATRWCGQGDDVGSKWCLFRLPARQWM